MSVRHGALIAAAGAGERLGSGPKAFLRLGDQSLLEHAVRAVSRSVDEIVVAVPAAHVDEVTRSLPGLKVVAGGRTRQESVLAMLAVSESEVVAVHDVARPFLTRDVLERVLAAAATHGAATAAVPVADTVVALAEVSEPDVAEGYGEVVDRDALRAVQTPQAFARELLLAAHEAAVARGLSATDDAALVRGQGHAVQLVPGSRLLFKITEPADLLLAEALLARRTSLAGVVA